MKVYLVYLGWSPKDISDWIGHTNLEQPLEQREKLVKMIWYRKRKKLGNIDFQAFLIVGATGFEPATSASRTQRSTKLGHAPFLNDKVDNTIFLWKFQVLYEKT